MNKYLLSLVMFGYFMAQKLSAQENGEGTESGETATNGESTEGTDSENSEGGSVSYNPNYFVGKFILESDAYVPNPYPLDTCVQTSIYANDSEPRYSMFACNEAGTMLFRDMYDNMNCEGNGTRISFASSDFDSAGDLNSFVCDGDDYSFELGVDCGGSASGDTVKVVPYVCFRDSDSDISVSNKFECNDGDTSVIFDVYAGDSCDGDAEQTNISSSCNIGVWIDEKITGLDADIGVKLITDMVICPAEGSTGGGGSDDDSDTGSSDSGDASILNYNFAIFAIIAVISFLLN